MHLASLGSWQVLRHVRVYLHLASLRSWRVFCHLRLSWHLASFGSWRILYHFRLSMHLASFDVWQVFNQFTLVKQLARFGSLKGPFRCIWQNSTLNEIRLLARFRHGKTFPFGRCHFPTWRYSNLALVGGIAK